MVGYPGSRVCRARVSRRIGYFRIGHAGGGISTGYTYPTPPSLQPPMATAAFSMHPTGMLSCPLIDY